MASMDTGAENEVLSSYLLMTCGIVAVALIVWRLLSRCTQTLRHVVCLNHASQAYFARPSPKISAFKKHFLYAPIWRKRHNREIQLSSAVNVATLPTRLQLVFLAGYLATNIAFCVVNIPFADSFDSAARQLRSRSGVLAVVNMVPLFLMAGRNNPLISLLGISFDTFNLLHRWFGRIVVLEALAHTLAHVVSKARSDGWLAALESTAATDFLLVGTIATCALIAIGIQALGLIRHAFYETFKILHLALAALALAATWYHLSLHSLPQIKYLIAALVFWVLERGARLIRVAYSNAGKGGTMATVEVLPGNACRVTATLARPWSQRPGQHAYLYMPGIGLWQSHPFSVAWADESSSSPGDKLAVSRQDYLGGRKMTVSFVVRARTGFTNRLFQKASDAPQGKFRTTCLVEGPYGGLGNLHSYGSVMLFAAGVGITHMVPHVRDLVQGYSNGTVAARKIVLCWVIQSPEHLEWIRPWMTDILGFEKRREVLRIMLFVSRPRSTKEIHSPSATVQMFPGRPNVDTLLGIEMEQQVGAMAVCACGPGAFSDEVRRAVRSRQSFGAVDFLEESFTW